MKLHQERECFRQVMRIFGDDILLDNDFNGNIVLKHYVSEYVYCSLLKKGRYGYRNDIINNIINDVDALINQSQIDALLRKFDTVSIKQIEERRDKEMDKQGINITNSTIVGAQVGPAKGNVIVDRTIIDNSNTTDTKLPPEILDAIAKINEIHELTDEQKNFMISLLSEAEESLHSNNINVQNSCHDRFKAFSFGAGNITVKVISALSGLTNILRIFGVPTP